MLRHFGFSLFFTIAAVIGSLLLGSPALAWTICVLIAIEIAFSFDNAIINAKVLKRMSPKWQRLFLTVGMVIAIVGMRLIFPIVIVMATTHLPWSTVVDDALHHPDVYAAHLAEAHPSIAAFGGSFLLVLSLYFLLDESREILWLHRIERPLQRLGVGNWMPPIFVAVTVIIVSLFAGQESGQVLRAGLFGVVMYTAIKLLVDFLERVTGKRNVAHYVGWAAFSAFMYLELLDASFSFDGVLGAFAITDKVVLIFVGLGVGALWVRSITVFMVRRGTLDSYKYLEHGAHYAIFVLALALLGSIFIEVPDAITGAVGLGIIGISFYESWKLIHAKSISN
jgi:hypothetical protein